MRAKDKPIIKDRPGNRVTKDVLESLYRGLKNNGYRVDWNYITARRKSYHFYLRSHDGTALFAFGHLNFAGRMWWEFLTPSEFMERQEERVGA